MDIKNWMPEFKVSAESDPELINYFLKTESVSKLIETSKWLLLGRKGTGKTAIYEYLRTAHKADLNGFETIPLNFKEYPWPVHRLYKEGMEGELSAYHKSWQYIIYIKILSQIIKQKEEKKLRHSTSLKNVKKYFEKIFGSPDPSLIEIIKSKVLRLEKISLPSGTIGEIELSVGEVSFETIQNNDELKSKLRFNAYALLDYFEKALIENLDDSKILIVLDQLDESWLTDEIPEYSKILVNLIHVCQNINSNNSKFSSKIKVVLFLRTDIYETLKFNDKTKVFQDSALEVLWNEDSLNDMYFERIKKYASTNVGIDTDLKTNAVFDVKTVRHGVSPFKHILRRSFMRPRDVIVFLNKVREAHQPGNSLLYTSKDLYEAEQGYSQSLYGELLDEWSNQKPEITKYLSIIQSIGFQSFAFDKYDNEFRKVFPEATVSDIQDSLLFLFKNSIVGQKLKANWTYVCSNPYMQIDFSKNFHVNTGLKIRLVLTESRSGNS